VLRAALGDRVRRSPSCIDEEFIDPSGRVAFGRVSLGFVNTHQQPATNGDRSVFAVMDGEIYDYTAQRRALEARGQRFATQGQAELLIVGFQCGGQDFFRGLHGKFTAAIWNSRSRQIFLVNDRFGMKLLYYSHAPGRCSFASSLHALLADPSVPRRTNRRGLAQLFTFGQLLGDDTLVEGAQLLPAASWLVYDLDADRLTVDRYWRLSARAPFRNRAESLERIDGAFERAVERCAADTDGLGLSLSGGMDARTILAVAAKPGRSLRTLTVGMNGSMDQDSAAAMAKMVNCPHHQVNLGENFLSNFEAHLRHMVRLTDGHYLCQCIVMPTLPVYPDLGIRVLLRGHAGELMHMGKAYNFSVDRDGLAVRDDAALMNWLWRHLRAYMSDGVDGPLFAGASQRDAESLASESLLTCVQETTQTEPTSHRIWHLFLTQRLRRETALSLVEFDSVVETRLPYLDNELIDELFAAPPELKLHDVIQAHILRLHRPEFLKIVNVNTGTVVGASTIRQSVARFRTRVFAKLGVSGFQPYERLGLWLRRELRPLVERLLLGPRCLERGVLDPDTVRAVVGNHLAGRRNHTFLVLAMMILEMSQREFMDSAAEATGPPSIGAVEGSAARLEQAAL
jgi:asparagine synthase (glutamine-hydrolysing)